MESVESLDNIHGYSGQSPGSPLRLDNVHAMDSVDIVHYHSLDNVHGHPGISGKCGHCPLITWTMSAEPMGSLDIVHGQSPLFVLTELVKIILVGVARESLEIHILP